MPPWSRVEVEAAVADYLDMLALEIRGEAFNKAEHNRNLRRVLNDRPPGSVERKHQNISAVLIELGFPYIDGYKPLGNYQALLREVVADRLTRVPDLESGLSRLVSSEPEPITPIGDILAMFVPPPEVDRSTVRATYETPAGSVRVKRNYLEIESRNRALGRAGEELVLQFEHERLWRAGEKRLADMVNHVSLEEGDGAGFDILSFETDGRERLIEVKTTRFGALTPFFASKNEVETSEIRNANYQLYRLFKFGEAPKLFALPGSLKKSCQLDPVQFQARVA